MADNEKDTKNVEKQNENIDDDFAMVYEDGYFAGEKFVFKDENTGKEIKIPYEDIKKIVIEKTKSSGEGSAQKSPSNGSEKDVNKNGGEQATQQNGKKEQFSPEELRLAQIQMDGKISNVLTIYKQVKGEELKREEIQTRLQALHAKGEEINLDTVDKIAEELYKEKKDAKEKEIQSYIDEKKKEKRPLSRSSAIVRDKTTQEEAKVKLDIVNVLDDFASFRSENKK